MSQDPTTFPTFDEFQAARRSATENKRSALTWGARRSGHKHQGEDFGGAIDSDVGAADDGEVIFAGPNGNMGNTVALRHANGLVTRYGHLNKINVATGAKVTRGDVIGLLGQTGNAKGPHVHYEVFQDDLPIDPAASPYRQPVIGPTRRKQTAPPFEKFLTDRAVRAPVAGRPTAAPPATSAGLTVGLTQTEQLPVRPPKVAMPDPFAMQSVKEAQEVTYPAGYHPAKDIPAGNIPTDNIPAALPSINVSLPNRSIGQTGSSVKSETSQRRPAPTAADLVVRTAVRNPEKLANDLRWHFGVNDAEELRKLPPATQRRMIAMATTAAAADERKRQQGIELRPSLEYQNQMRGKVGLGPNGTFATQQSAVPPLIDRTIPDLTSSLVEAPLTFAEDRAIRVAVKKDEQQAREALKTRLQSDPNTFGAEYANYLRLNRTSDSPGMREDFLDFKVKQASALEGGGNAFGGGSARGAIAARDAEKARQQRVAQMGTVEYLAQAPKSAATGFTDAFATSLKGIAALAKKLDFFDEYKGKKTSDLATYELGEAIQRGMRDVLGSNEDLEQEFGVGQVPAVFGQVGQFMLGGWATKSPKVAAVILGSAMTAGDAYDEVRARGGSDEEAVNAALLAGGLLGPTELIGMRGAMKALEGTAKAATWRAALRTALREGRRDIIENALQEVGQEFGQGLITGNPRSLEQLLQAGLLGGIGGTATTPLTLVTSAPGIARSSTINDAGKTGNVAAAIPQETGENITKTITASAVPKISENPPEEVPVNEQQQSTEVAAQALKPATSSSPVEAGAAPNKPITTSASTELPAPETKQIVRHSDPNIDGGEVIGRAPDGRLKVRNKEGGISLVQDPRKQGNREAALVKETPISATQPASTEAATTPTTETEAAREPVAAGAAPTPPNTAEQLDKARDYQNRPHFVVQGFNESPLRQQVLDVLPPGSELYNPVHPDSPEMQFGAIKLRAPNGDIWELDLAYDHRKDPDWKTIGTWMDGYAVRNTGQKAEAAIARVASTKEPLEPTETIEPAPKSSPRQLRAESEKDYRQKIDFLRGYLDLDKERRETGEKMAGYEPDHPQYRALDEHLDKLDRALDLQARRGAENFGFSIPEFIDLVNDFESDQSSVKRQFYPQRSDSEQPTTPRESKPGEPHPVTGRKFSSTQVDLPNVEAKLQKQAAAAIPDSELAADGREETPHVTVKYGLHSDDATELHQLLADEPPVKLKIGKVSIFAAKGDADYDVVKMDVDSPDLHRLNAKIAKALPVTDTHPEYKPHVTLAYVKPGEGAKYVGQSNALTGREVTLDKILFSSRSGSEVEIPLTGTTAAAKSANVRSVKSGTYEARLENEKVNIYRRKELIASGKLNDKGQVRGITFATPEHKQSAPVRNAVKRVVRQYEKEFVSKPATKFQQTGQRQTILRPTDTLWQFVQKRGGIAPADNDIHAGELARLTSKATGKIGLLNKANRQGNQRFSAEYMMDAANEAGYRDRNGEPFTSIGDFIIAVADDANGLVASHSVEHANEFDYEAAYYKHLEEQQENEEATARAEASADALVSLLENEYSGHLYDLIESGRADEGQINEFTQLATAAGVIPEDLEAVLAAGRDRASQTNPLQDTFERSEEAQPADEVISSSSKQPSQQLGFVEPGLTQQESRLPPRLPDQREQLLRDEQERQAAANPLRTAALKTLEEIRRRGMTVDDYARQDVLFGEKPTETEIELLRELEAGEEADEQPDQQATFLSEPVGVSSEPPLREWATRLKTIVQSKNVPDLHALSDEMARHRDDPRVAQLHAAIQSEIERVQEASPLFSRAYHGSPYAFDRFSTERIGTGEGAQSYGYGLYFTDRSEIAEFYKRKLQPGRGVEPRDVAARIYESLPDSFSEAQKTAATIRELQRRKADSDPTSQNFLFLMDEAIEAVRSGNHKGRLYEVELAPKEDEYLLWDRPLSEQSEKVKKALTKAFQEIDLPEGGQPYAGRNPDGQSIYATISSAKGFERDFGDGDTRWSANIPSEKDGSEYLHSLGIRGIKYLDQGSRNVDEDKYEVDQQGNKFWGIQRRQSGVGFAASTITDSSDFFDTRKEAQDWVDAQNAKLPKPSYNYVIFSDADVEIRRQFAKGWLRADTSTGEKVQASVEANRVSMNAAAARVLSDMYRELGIISSTSKGVRGAYERQGYALARNLDKMADRGVVGAEQFADAVRRAAKTGEGRVVLFYGEGARRHELFHETSERANRYLSDRHGKLESLTSVPQWERIQRWLTREGYPNQIPVLVEEAAAHIAEGRYEEMGLSREEAIDWMELWFTSFAKKNPDIGVREFKELADAAEKARERVYEAQSRAFGQPYENVSRVAEGRPEGYRASLARAPDLTRTEAFKRWFGRSKVVDKNGSPLVVYHRSPFRFTAFDPDKVRHFGFHFGTRAQARQVDIGDEPGRMYPVYLRIENPLRLEDLGDWSADRVTEELRQLNLITEEQVGEVSESYDPARQLREILKKKGYDGIVYENFGERQLVNKKADTYVDSYIAFDPTQIKSADKNWGTFDPNDPNILLAREPVDPWERLSELAEDFERMANEPKGEKPRTGPIQDLGEKIGGARKDTAVSAGPRVKAEKPVDETPAWRKRFLPMESKTSGRWFLLDTKTGRSVTGPEFSTEAEAQQAVPLAAVSLKHTVYPTRGNEAYEIWRKVTDRKRVKVVDQEFATREDALRYMAQHAEEIVNTKTGFGEEILAVPDKVKRAGTPRRQGDVDGNDFMEAFGFRGVEFGNWNNAQERQEVLNHAYDGLHDLAEVLNVPPLALSLNGELGLAFGARGQGLSGAKAHYERNYGVINLTKMKGAGSLAHEWFHALDHYFGRVAGKAKAEKVVNKSGDMVYPAAGAAGGDYVSHGFGYKSKARPELQAAYDDVIKTIFKKAERYTEDTAQAEKFVGGTRRAVQDALDKIRRDLAEQKDPKYWKRNNAPASAEQLAEFDQLAQQIIDGNALATEFRANEGPNKPRSFGTGRFSNDVLDGISAIYKAVRGRSGFSSEHSGILDYLRGDMSRYSQRLKMLQDANSGMEKEKHVPTSYAMEAKKIDQGRASDYWTTPHEMAARAFSSYVEDKIAEVGNQSQFLAYGANNNLIEYRLLNVRPFPEGKERSAINEAFDRLFKTMQVTSRTERGRSYAALGERDIGDVNPPVAPPDPIVSDGDPAEAHAMALSSIRMPVSDVAEPGYEKSRVSAAQVIKSYEAILSSVGRPAPIRTGRISQRNVRGIYKPDAEVIRLKTANNIPTAAHETGHALQKVIYGSAKSRSLVVPGPVKRELVNLGKALYGSRKPAGGYRTEGFAEFMRYYLTRDDVTTVAPETTELFEGTILPAHPKIAKAINEARAKTDSYRKQGAKARGEANIEKLPNTIVRGWQKVNDAFRRVPKAWIDEFTPLFHLSKFAAGKAGPLPASQDPAVLASALRATAGAKVAYMVNEGMIDFAGNVVGPPLRDATSIVKGKETDFALYLHAKRAQERWSKDKNPGMSREDADALVAQLETPQFQLAAQKVYDWNDGILSYVEQAVPSMAEAIKKIRSESQYYVPLQRSFAPEEVKGSKGGGAVGGNALKQMKGSGRAVKEIFPQMLQNAEQMLSKAHKRAVLDAIVRLSDIEGLGHLVEEVPKDRAPVTISAEQAADALRGLGYDVDDAARDELVTFFTPSQFPKGQTPIIPLMRDGQMKWYQVEPEVYNTLAGIDLYRLHPLLDLIFGVPTRIFRLGVTGLRPAFSLLTNPMRDVQTFIMQSKSHKNPAHLAAIWVSEMARAFNPARLAGHRDPFLDLFERLGAQVSQPLGADIAATRRVSKELFRGKVMNTVTHPLTMARELLSLPESASRTAELRAIADEIGWKPGQPLTLDQSIEMTLAAKRVTTDFSAGGHLGKIMNQAVPFFNAAVQGGRTFTRTMKEKPHRSLLRGLLLITLPTLFLWWKNKDKEWYRDMLDRDRFTYWHIQSGNQILRIPKAFEWGNLFAVAPEAIFDSWYQRDPAGITAAMGQIFETAVPDVLPVPAKAAKEQWLNSIEFFNKPIVPRGELDLPASEQRGPYTSAVATWLGKHLPDAKVQGVPINSPRRIDALIRSLGGGVAPDVLNVVGLGGQRGVREYEPSDLPVIGRLFRPGGIEGMSSKAMDSFYDRLTTANARAGSKDQPETAAQREDRLLLEDANKAIQVLRLIQLETPALADRQGISRMSRLIAATAQDQKLTPEQRVEKMEQILAARPDVAEKVGEKVRAKKAEQKERRRELGQQDRNRADFNLPGESSGRRRIGPPSPPRPGR